MLEQIQNENEQLRSQNRHVIAQLQAMNQCLDEYKNANIGLRSSCILLEEDLKKAQQDVSSLTHRCNDLENDKASLKRELDQPSQIETNRVSENAA